VPKIISKRRELVKLCDINCSGPVFLDTLVFPYQTAWQYSERNLLTGVSNAGGVGRNRES